LRPAQARKAGSARRLRTRVTACWLGPSSVVYRSGRSGRGNTGFRRRAGRSGCRECH
jgi:hypothetical protein